MFWWPLFVLSLYLKIVLFTRLSVVELFIVSHANFRWARKHFGYWKCLCLKVFIDCTAAVSKPSCLLFLSCSFSSIIDEGLWESCCPCGRAERGCLWKGKKKCKVDDIFVKLLMSFWKRHANFYVAFTGSGWQPVVAIWLVLSFSVLTQLFVLADNLSGLVITVVSYYLHFYV